LGKPVSPRGRAEFWRPAPLRARALSTADGLVGVSASARATLHLVILLTELGSSHRILIDRLVPVKRFRDRILPENSIAERDV